VVITFLVVPDAIPRNEAIIQTVVQI
jgi:hypothetical protein